MLIKNDRLIQQNDYVMINDQNEVVNSREANLEHSQAEEAIISNEGCINEEIQNSQNCQKDGSEFDYQEISMLKDNLQSFEDAGQQKISYSDCSLYADPSGPQKDESLYSRLPKVASKFDKIRMYQLVKRGNLYHLDRRYIWLFATGALGAMANCHKSQSYFNILKSFDKSFPNPNFKQIAVDLPRTFQDEEYYMNPRIMKAVDNILRAYSIRNPTIGYCQGFNFIVGRLLRVVNEEEAFWMFCQIIETMMPLDYYSNMVGALIDQKVFIHIFQQTFPDLFNHLESLGCEPSLITFQWFACFFSYNVPFHILERIWDLFFLKGSKVLFRISLAIIHMIKGDLMKTTDFQQIFKLMETFPQKLQNSESLFQLTNMKKYKISNQKINEDRANMRSQVIDEIQSYSQELTKSINEKLTRVKFLNKFYLYAGISKQIEHSKTFDITKSECISHLKCDKNWPVCLFDFTYKNKVPEYFAFRVDNSSYIIDDNHFYGSQNNSIDIPIIPQFYANNDIKKYAQFDQIKEESDNDLFSPFKQKNGSMHNPNHLSGAQFSSILSEEATENDLMIERNSHFCSNQSVESFKRLLRCNDLKMYSSEHLNFKITDEPESISKIESFVKQVNDIEENKDKINNLIRCLKRSNSEYNQNKPQTRMRTQSNDEDDKFRSLQQSKASSNSHCPTADIRLRTKSGKVGERRSNQNKLRFQHFKGESCNLQTCTLACLFKGNNRKQLEKYIKDIQIRGFDIFESFLQDFQDEKVTKEPSLSPSKSQD